MCGILGYSLKPGQALPEGCLEDALAAIRHRGPDASGTVVSEDGRIGLGHARLSIIDLSEAGSQPMTTPTGSHSIVYNGELYDFGAMRQLQAERGVSFRGHSDTEVLLNALAAEGLGSLGQLNGMFAFALWDHATDEVTLVRDGFGIKPLYVAQDSRGVFFASEMRALLHMGVTPDQPDPLEAARYLHNLWNQAGHLPSPNIWKLSPGEALVIADGAIRRHWTWHSPAHLAPRHVQRPVDEAARQLADTLRQSVQRQLVADVPVGAFLSGGLDSSAIVAFARETVPDIACFTIDTSGGTEAGTADDLPYARRVARHLGVPLHDVRIDPDRMAQDMQAMIAQLEEPVADPACLNTFYISRLARDNGITVLLSGAGGDDLFTGYRRHRALMMDKYLMALPRPARTLMQATLRRMGTGSSLLRRLNKLADGITLSASDRLLNYFAWTGRTDLIEILAPQTRRQVAIDRLTAPMRAYLDQMADSADPMDRMLALEQRFFLAEHNLIYTDKMSMAASVEVRVPFLDPDLAAFAASLPTPVKQKGKEGKWIFKKAMEPYLPHDVIYRPKTGFGAPLRSWLTGDLRAVMDDLLSEETINRRGLFDAAALHRLRQDTEQARKDGSYTLFSAMCIELWARQFIDGQPGPLLSQY